MPVSMDIATPRPGERQAVLIAARNAKMARSAHAYVRGSTRRFYEWLDGLSGSAIPEGPSVWICGDCHVGNLGPVANADGKIDIQIRDFDQTIVGNPAHDLIRLGLSLAMAARSSDLPGVTTARMLERLAGGYEKAFVDARSPAGSDMPGTVTTALADADRRSWRHLARDRVDGATVAIPLGKRFWPLSADERRQVEALVQGDDVQRLATLLDHRSGEARVELLDAAYWMKGCSSLGLLRYAVLLDVGRRASRGRDLCLLDIKEAPKTEAPRSPGAAMPRDNAERVVEGAVNLAPYLGQRMAAARFLDRPVFLRELLPQDLKLEFANLTQDEAVLAADYLARVVGRAHARQMPAPVRAQWRKLLRGNRSKSLDAPSWLWTSVIDLVATHERAYLDHCRRHALADA